MPASLPNNAMDTSEHPPSRILIVDDTPPVLRALERQLELAGYAYISARDGIEAQAVLEARQDIDLILSDWFMPRMDGFALLAWAKNHPSYRHVPFLMLTGEDSSEDAAKALRAGASDYIRKPYPPEVLLARVGNLLQAATMRRQLREQATQDDLTGLANKRSFDEALQREIARVRRYTYPLCLLLLDLDQGNRLAESCGPPTGEMLLAQLGALLPTLLRATDIPCRFGATEVAILLPHTDMNGAGVVAERLRSTIAQHAFAGGKGACPITCSLGITAFNLIQDDATAVVQRVATACQQAKAAGGNRIVIAA